MPIRRPTGTIAPAAVAPGVWTRRHAALGRCAAASILLLVLLLPGCSRTRAGGPAVAAPLEPTWTSVPATRLYYDNAGGVLDSARVVIREADHLARVWAQVTSRQAAPPPAPEVDFEREMLLMVAAGRRSPEDRITVDSARVQRRAGGGAEADLAFAVTVRLAVGCGRFAADAYPVEIVRVGRSTAPVRWIEVRDQAECARSLAPRPPVTRIATRAGA
jgi:hypothetical protein